MQELEITLEIASTKPLVEQLYAYLKTEITHKRLGKGEKLPSKRRLASSLGCSVNTIQGAYNQLVDEGYLEAREKSGYYVANLEGMLDISSPAGNYQLQEQQKKCYLYDFSCQGVDLESFPFSSWRSLNREILTSKPQALLKSGNPKGEVGLRSSIAKYLQYSRGVRCSAEQIIISSGTESLLQLLIQLLDEDTVFGLENPGYEKLSLLFKHNRANYVSIALDQQGMDTNALLASAADVACITPSHQFPTGRIMPVSRRLQLLKWAQENPRRFLVEDDYDSEFRYSGKPIPSLQGLDTKGKVIYLGAFSKSLSPALRVSYMVLPQALAGWYAERLQFYMCPVPILEQMTLQAFIEGGYFERHVNRMRNLYKQKREVLIATLEENLPYCTVEGTAAGLHCMVHVNKGLDEQALVTKAEKLEVKVYGISNYYADPIQTTESATVLLGFATLRMEDIPKAVKTLAQAWR